MPIPALLTNVEPPEGLNGGRDERTARLLLRDVDDDFNRMGASLAQFGRGLRVLRFVAPADHHRGPCLRKAARHAKPDAAIAAGDDGGASGQVLASAEIAVIDGHACSPDALRSHPSSSEGPRFTCICLHCRNICICGNEGKADHERVSERWQAGKIRSLAEALVMDAGALAHTLKPLERDGLIVVAVDPDDRRNRLITLTRHGRQKLAETDALWANAQRGFDAAFGRAESKALREALRFLISDDFAIEFKKVLPASGC
jgi:DNA-binding MarR family transcriptional regulator